jgi:dipeptidyl aminopeptidase/acylaminoacyl peptidase
VLKAVDDLMWQTKLGDIADVDKVEYTSLPPHRAQNPNAPGATNPVIVHAYTFIPKKLDRARKQPLIVLSHGGVHANFDSSAAHIVREFVEQGYSIVAPDYRGSTGYGRGFYEEIDYGGLEVDDVYAGCQWMPDEHDFLDPNSWQKSHTTRFAGESACATSMDQLFAAPSGAGFSLPRLLPQAAKRVGIAGWSHGGLIALMNIFQHPQTYAVAYAGVPVSDLVARMGYESESYRQQYSAPYHIGKTVREDIQEYLRRSPYFHASELQTPLLIHSNTIDEDVNVLEVQHLIDSLKAAGKKFEYKIYENAPGGHRLNRTDTKLAKESRREVYLFLASYLHPANPAK